MKRFPLAVLLLIYCSGLWSQSLNKATMDYIDKYKAIAQEQERIYKIPACITLAQGILESGSGTSRLAVEANNHFGIKCHRDWEGEKFYKDDDRRNECFRVYASAEESYTDHSLFLKKKRYADLFELDIKDYKAWAKGLKRAGYATNPDYPQLLVNLIETYGLADMSSLPQNIAEVEKQETEANKISAEELSDKGEAAMEETVKTRKRMSLAELIARRHAAKADKGKHVSGKRMTLKEKLSGKRNKAE